jgi:NAD/NADP transhydrogenase alpha subunit
MPMLMTAAGTVKAARVLILGAGVAGLQAIATAKRLGAIVEASDVRPAVKEQIESLGAKFIDVPFETEEEENILFFNVYFKNYIEKAFQIITLETSVFDFKIILFIIITQ